MTLEDLINEGRRLERPCNLLKDHPNGDQVALWYPADSDDESVTGFRRWITVRADALPNAKAPPEVFFSVYTTENLSGRLDFVDGWPPRDGTPLFAHPTSIRPPIDAIFAFGSDKIATWLAELKWERTRRPESYFPEWDVVKEYERLWLSEHPVFNNAPDVYAIAGGWHMPTAWNDWHELAAAKLLLTTVKDSEPWIEAFQLADGDYKVIQRVT
jgi:hypothetical protein